MLQEGVAVEIAEAVIGALRGDLAATAVNAPMVPHEVLSLPRKEIFVVSFQYNYAICLHLNSFFAQVLSELSPYVFLAEKLGRLVVQLVAGGSGIKRVKVVYSSARDPDDLDTRILRAMVTKGIIEPISSAFVNIVNADYVAKQRGLQIVEERIWLDGSPEVPLDSIQVHLANVESKFAGALSDAGDIRVEGKVKDGTPHLTLVGSFNVDVSLEGNLLLCCQVDQPGIIGKVGSILGNMNVNVNFMSVGRTAPGKEAIMAIGVDEEPEKEALKLIGEIQSVVEFIFLKL